MPSQLDAFKKNLIIGHISFQTGIFHLVSSLNGHLVVELYRGVISAPSAVARKALRFITDDGDTRS